MPRTKPHIASSPKPTPAFSQDDLAAELSRALAQQPDLGADLTTAEMTDVTGWPPGRVDKALAALFRAKRLKARRVYRPARDGNMRISTAYEILPV